LSSPSGQIWTKFYRRIVRVIPRRSQKRFARYSILAVNFVLLMGVVVFVLSASNNSPSSHQNAVVAANSEVASNPLDQLSSADIAVSVARLTNLAEAKAVATNADTVNAQLTLSSADSSVVSKPQIVASAGKSRKDIQTYVTKAGDTISALAAKFGVTSDSIRWSNNLVGAPDGLSAGKSLLIPPISGIVYQVKAGDTADSLAVKYRASKEQIIAFNDAELSGLPVGQYIVVPDGVQVPARTSTAGSSVYTGGFAWGGYSPVYGGNGYDYGYCTWWAAVRRAQIGHPIPSNLGNASTWKVLAQRSGIPVGNTPRAGAVIWTPPRDYYGHVGFVESVNADGSVNISEMNTAGWGVVTRKTISAQVAAGYSYIYW
jgi:surface antigen